jgi:hypothetical protein
MTTTLLDLLGAASLAVFAFLVWPPLVLLVVGVAALVASWKATR